MPDLFVPVALTPGLGMLLARASTHTAAVARTALPAVRRLSALTTGFTGLFGGEFVSGAFFVGDATTRTPRLAGLFRGELVRSAFFVRGATALGGDFSLLIVVHTGKATPTVPLVAILIVCHFRIPSLSLLIRTLSYAGLAPRTASVAD